MAAAASLGDVSPCPPSSGSFSCDRPPSGLFSRLFVLICGKRDWKRPARRPTTAAALGNGPLGGRPGSLCLETTRSMVGGRSFCLKSTRSAASPPFARDRNVRLWARQGRLRQRFPPRGSQGPTSPANVAPISQATSAPESSGRSHQRTTPRSRQVDLVNDFRPGLASERRPARRRRRLASTVAPPKNGAVSLHRLFLCGADDPPDAAQRLDGARLAMKHHDRKQRIDDGELRDAA